MNRMTTIGTSLYTLIGSSLIFIAVALMMLALWNAAVSFVFKGNPVTTLLDAFGLIFISMAVVDVARYLFEEAVEHGRELRSALEARRSLTRFMAIVCVAVTVEGLVHTSRAVKAPGGSLTACAVLLFSSVTIMIGLGACQRMSRIVDIKDQRDSGVLARHLAARVVRGR